MRHSHRVVLAGLVLILGAAAGSASAAEREPLSGGLLALPGEVAPAPTATAPRDNPVPTAPALLVAPPPPPAPAPAMVLAPIAPAAPAAPPRKVKAESEEDDTSWGLLVRGGYFGLPSFIADELFVRHPAVKGSSIGAEIRYHGEGGGRGIASIGLAVDSATCKADGEWQQNETSEIKTASGDISMLAITVTGYWSLFPSWYVHPYFGLGIGAARVKGYYKNETDRVDADVWIPALHVPLGLAIELGKRWQLTVEGRVINGVAIGGALQVRF